MATTHKVKWAVSASPIVTVDAVDGASLETNTLHENIRRTLGGSGESTTDGAIDYGGVADGATNYLSATTGGVQIGNTDSTFIWVKHTGYDYDDPTTLGPATTDNLNIEVGGEVCAVLQPGEGMVFPLHGAGSGSDWFAKKTGGNNIAIEAIGLD